jgi:hypothetical protein
MPRATAPLGKRVRDTLPPKLRRDTVRMKQHIAVILFACAVAGASVGYPSDLEPTRAGQDSFVSRAIFANGQLWLLTDGGAVSTIAPGSNQRREVALPESALDLWSFDGRPMVLTGNREGGPSWTVRSWNHGGWVSTGTVAISGEVFIAASSSKAATVILTSRRLIEVSQNEIREVDVSWPEHEALRGIPSMHITPDQVLLGRNAGEWGGGLFAINRTTGTVRSIEERSADLCAGVLNAECDPVTGISDEPGHPNCVVASIGLRHLLSRGRIVEVCGTAVRKVYSSRDSSLGRDLLKRIGIAENDADRAASVPFFGITTRDNAIWAVSPDRLYEIKTDGSIEAHPLPNFDTVGTIQVSFADPKFVFVRTDINERHSASGSVPILVPREVPN